MDNRLTNLKSKLICIHVGNIAIANEMITVMKDKNMVQLICDRIKILSHPLPFVDVGLKLSRILVKLADPLTLIC